MDPQIVNQMYDGDFMKFTLMGVDTSVANALRRTIVSDIPTIVIRGFPHEKNKVNIDVNTTKLNNEIIKHRLSCIPIHIDDPNTFIETSYQLELDIKNTTDDVIIITTGDFKMKNTALDSYVSEEEVHRILPMNITTNSYIEILRLMPAISSELNGEHIKLSITFDIGTAKENSCWNVASTCAYSFSPDTELAEKEWEKREKELVGMSASDLKYAKKDFMYLDAQRYFVHNSFDFIIETLNIYENLDLLKFASIILRKKFVLFIKAIEDDPSIIQKTDTNMPYSYQIELTDEDYTFGKVFEKVLYNDYFIMDKKISFVTFKKMHPLDNNSFIDFALIENLEKEMVIKMLTDVATKCGDCFEKLEVQFK